jgi:hypothetical protein
MPEIPRALRALLTDIVDYAGLYPPAALPLQEVEDRYQVFLASPDRWILNRLVLPADKLTGIQPDWRITALVDGEPGPLAPQVEALETRGTARLSLITYCEAPIEAIEPGAFAKIRTGGVTPDAIPPIEALTDFLMRAAARRIPFKATAGLHHPLRSERALTYADDAPRAVMHGFLNLFIAAAFAWAGVDAGAVAEILGETEAAAFGFRDEDLSWRGHKLSTVDVAEARRSFAHCFGSCSFQEPLADLRELGLLP